MRISEILYPSSSIKIAFTEETFRVWREKYNAGHEVIFRHKSGPVRIFPDFKCNISNLDPDEFYHFSLCFLPCSGTRLHICERDLVWKETGHACYKIDLAEVLWHPNGKQLGSVWMNDGINFENIHVFSGSRSRGRCSLKVKLQANRRYVLALTVYRASGKEDPLKKIRMTWSRYSEFLFLLHTYRLQQFAKLETRKNHDSSKISKNLDCLRLIPLPFQITPIFLNPEFTVKKEIEINKENRSSKFNFKNIGSNFK